MADPDDLLSPDDAAEEKSSSVDELTDDELDALDPDDEVGGDSAEHPDFVFPSVLVGPSTSDQFNTIEEWIRPIACWRLDDTRFEFDSSFVKPGAARELRLLTEIRADHPGATLSLFGQADPSGADEYNKALSGRRARAVYGMLTRRTDIWEQLFKKDPKSPGDVWGTESLATMLATVGRSPDEAGKLDESGRKALYLQYMDRLCGPRLKLDPATDFLAHAGDSDLRGDVQGCSEFNPVLRFSASENAEFSKSSRKTQRDSENAPNRRLVGFLFSKELRVDAKRWPCPAATESTARCTKRLFVDHLKRRANQPKRRTFADDRNTFECRFYHRLAIQSPCETSLLTSLQRIRVRLVLQYLDPEGKAHPFPKGYRVSALSPDGTTRNARVGDGGRVRFVIDRPKESFRLEFNSSDTLYFGSAAPGTKAAPADKLIAEEHLEEALRQGFRVFKVPHQWSTGNSDWIKVDSPMFVKNTGEFIGIGVPDSVIGTIDAPVSMLLDPHWQFLRWVYFDRILLQQLPCPPMMVEGFHLAELAFGEPDTRSNWTTGANNQALPWIIRDEAKRPDGDVLIQLNTGGKQKFIETRNGSRKIVTVDDGGGPDTVKTSVVRTPSVERMNFYDLPLIWKSRGYFTRIGSAGDVFEKVGVNQASDGQPIRFSLDDVVLTDDGLKPLTWNPTNDRVAIFSNKLHLGLKSGLFRPDSAVPYISQIPALVKDRNYLADYPDWARLIAMRGSLFDVFDRRVPDSGTGVTGARAAVRWVDGGLSGGAGGSRKSSDVLPVVANRTVTAVQLAFFQNHEFRTGRADQASLRCCDVDAGTEVGVNLHYLRLNFNFSPAQPAPPAPPKVPNTIANQQAWVNDGAANVAQRWNGPAGDLNKGNVTLVPVKGSPPLRMQVIWFLQIFPHPLTAALNKSEAQFTIDVWKTGRAFMQDSTGKGEMNESNNQPAANDRFTMAHESGHGDSLADEYLEPAMDASYLQPGYREYLPGGPFLRDDGKTASIMNSNKEVRGRHFWHAAEWLRSIHGTEFAVKYDGLTYSLPAPFPANAPADTFATVPFVPAPDVRSGNGFYNCWLYRLGQDKFSVSILKHGPFDGFLSVNVRIKCTFLDAAGKQITNHVELMDSVSKMFSAVRDQIGGKFFARGSANGVTFSKVYIDAFPRFLVVNNSGDPGYLQGLDNPGNLPYATLVTNIETGATSLKLGPTHFNVNLTRNGTTNLIPNAGGAGTLNFNMAALNLTADFPIWFAGMLGINTTKDAMKNPASYVPVVQQVLKDGKVFALPG